MTYSLNRAIPLAIIGFIAGAGLVILLRGLQSMDQIWDPQIGLILGGFVAAACFLWGIGGFSKTMAAHHVPEPEEDEFGNELPVEDHHHAEETPNSILTEQIWQIAFWTTMLFAGLLIFAALPGGFGYTVSNDATANANTNGFFPFNWFGTTLYVSKLVAFILFTAFTIISLAGAAWLSAKTFVGLNRGLKTTKAVGNQALKPLFAPALTASGAVAALPSGERAVEAVPVSFAGESEPRERGLIGWTFWKLGQLWHFVVSMILDEPTPEQRHTTQHRLLGLVILVLATAVLHLLFYEIFIGFVIAQPYWLRIIVSLVNAMLVTLLIFRTKWVLYIIGRIARFSAWLLRALPAFLFQRD